MEAQRLRLAWANYGLEKKKLDQAEDEQVLAADGVLREISDIINKGDKPENYIQTVSTKDGRARVAFKINEPTLLQKFGNIDKEGKTTNVPDEARFNKETGEVDLIYFEKDELGNVNRNKVEDRKSLNQRTWVNVVAQRSFGGQDRGKANQILQDVITKSGGNLYNIARQLGEGAAPMPSTNQPSSSAVRVEVNGKIYEVPASALSKMDEDGVKYKRL